jgi:hypothetical protein
MALITIATGRLDADLAVRIRGITGESLILKSRSETILPPTEHFKAHVELGLGFSATAGLRALEKCQIYQVSKVGEI